MKSDLVDIEVIYHHQTEKAIKFAKDEDSEPEWIPKASCEMSFKGPRPIPNRVITLTMPEHVALDKELI